jgi:hypothetical protein
MIRVSLTQTEFMVINYVGKLRSQITSERGTDMLQDANMNGIQSSIDGVLTEYAVAKYLNLHLDLNCDFRKFGADLVSAKGAMIDVKSTRVAGGNLNAVGWSIDKTADIYILTEILPTCVGIVGWIHRDSFLRNENVVTPKGRQPYYSVSRDKLTPFYEQANAETL